VCRVTADTGLMGLRHGADERRHHQRVDRVATVGEHLRARQFGERIAHHVSVRLRRPQRGLDGRTSNEGGGAGLRKKATTRGKG